MDQQEEQPTTTQPVVPEQGAPAEGDSSHPDSIGAILERVLDDVEEVGSRKTADPTNSLRGLLTGFRELDQMLGGLIAGTLTVIASRPGMGRSTLLSDFCRQAAVTKRVPTAVYSLEETAEQFTLRMQCAECRVSRYHLVSGTMTSEDWSRLARRMPELASAPLYVQSPSNASCLTIRMGALEHVTERDVRLIAVDGPQNLISVPARQDQAAVFGEALRELKAFALEQRVPVVVTAPLKPAARRGQPPTLDDLDDAAAYAADTVILVHRPDAFDPESPRSDEVDLLVPKSRAGIVATTTVAAQFHYGRLVDLAPSPQGV